MEKFPVTMTIAGSDSSGGAGIQADLRAFHYFHVYGTSAVTAITAQNPQQVLTVHPIPADVVEAQVKAVRTSLDIKAIKTGMLFSSAIIHSVAREIVLLRNNSPNGEVPVVIDPVMVSTSGEKLLKDEAMCALEEELLPLATLLTPNIPEAEILYGKPIENVEDIHLAGRYIADRFNCAVLLKGGHADGALAVDILFQTSKETLNPDLSPITIVEEFSLPRVEGALSTHGSGCSLSAAIAANLARGCTLMDAIKFSKDYVHQSIANSVCLGEETAGMWPYNTV